MALCKGDEEPELLDLVSDQKTKNALWKKIEKVEQERTE